MAKKIKPKTRSGLMNQFEKGESGNPNGRRKGSKNRSTVAREILGMKNVLSPENFAKLKTAFPEAKKTMTVEHLMTLALANKAITKADHNAYLALMDSRYGKAMQEHQLAGPNGGPIRTEHANLNVSDEQALDILQTAVKSKKYNLQDDEED